MFSKSGISHQFLACIPVLFNQLLVGFGWGWTSPTLMKLRDPTSAFTITDHQASWIASMHEFGRFSSPFVSPLIVDSIGRKYSVALVTTLFLVVWPSQIFIRDFYLLCVVRVLFGLANGLHDVVASTLTTENCSTELRGVIGSCTQVLFMGGILLETILATYLRYELANAVSSFVAVCAFASLYFCVETPHFAFMKERSAQAEQSLRWLRNDLSRAELSGELHRIRQNVHEEREKQKSVRTLFASSENVRSISIVLVIYLCSSCTGFIAIGAYGGAIFQPSDSFTPKEFTVLYGAGNFAMVCLSLLVVKRVGRRTILIATHLVITLSNLSLFALFYLRLRKHYEMGAGLYSWLVFASAAANGSCRSLAGSTLYTIRGELLPLSVRAIGGSMAIVMFSLGGFIGLKTFLPISEHFGIETNFLLYFVIALLITLTMCYCLPETRGKSLEEIQQRFKASRGTAVVVDTKRSYQTSSRKSDIFA